MGLGRVEGPALEGVVPVPYRLGTVPNGDAGVRETLNIMVEITLAYRASPSVRTWAQELATQCANRDRLCQVEMLQGWVRDAIRYLPDVRDVETIQTPDYTLAMGSGDCDDQSVLLAAGLESIGFETRFAAQAIGSREFSHVSSQVHLGRGWMNLETILPTLPQAWGDWPAGAPMPAGWWPPNVVRVMLARVP